MRSLLISGTAKGARSTILTKTCNNFDTRGWTRQLGECCQHRSYHRRVDRIKDLLDSQRSGIPVTVAGLVNSIRSLKNVSFSHINDGSTDVDLQIVLPPDIGSKLHIGSSVEISGKLVPSKGKDQSLEMIVESMNYLGDCDPKTYPFQKNHEPNLVAARKYAHLRPRLSSIASILRLRNNLTFCLHEYLVKTQGMTQIHTPIITSSDCEGAGEMFSILAPTSADNKQEQDAAASFFGRRANLTVSSQLHLEAMCSALGNVYTLSPVFRAENSSTNRHLAEFYMMEVELAFVTELNEVMDVVEGTIRGILERAQEYDPGCFDPSRYPRAQEEEANNNNSSSGGGGGGNGGTESSNSDQTSHQTSNPIGMALQKAPWKRMSYTKSIQLLKQQHEIKPFQFEPVWGHSLQAEHEKWLAGSHVGGPVFVHDYPKSLKPFYMRQNDFVQDQDKNPQEGQTVACFDLLVPEIGELAGGSLREERFDVLQSRIEHDNLSKSQQKELEWYMDLRRFGTIPHGGFGLGWDRFLSYVSQTENLKEVVAFPRFAGHGSNFVG